MFNTEEVLHSMALPLISGLSHATAKALVQYFGTATAVFQASASDLVAAKLLSGKVLKALLSRESLVRAERHWKAMDLQQIQVLRWDQQGYPQRLAGLEDCPFLLYFKGTEGLNALKTVALVGTRKPTPQGQSICEQLVEQLQAHGVCLISGLAYGIDVVAHQRALDLGLLTIGIVGHGLDMVYPAAHRRIAQRMAEQGGLLTEHPWATPPAREHFPMRNRLIAGLSDAVIVVESGLEGGSMITANFAQGYQRHVFAIPGRIQDSQSQGCNALIRDHKAQLLSSIDDLLPALGWEAKAMSSPQPMLFPQLNEAETQVIHALLGQEAVSLEQLFLKLQWPSAQLSTTLLNLEIQGLIKALPGKFYKIR